MTFTIRTIHLGWSGWAKYAPMDRMQADNVQQVINAIEAQDQSYLVGKKDPTWMICIYIGEDKGNEPIAIKTPLGWQVK